VLKPPLQKGRGKFLPPLICYIDVFGTTSRVANRLVKRTERRADSLSFHGSRSVRPKRRERMMDEADQKLWQRQFNFCLFPYSPILSSLMEAADKLGGAMGFLEGLSPEVDAERELGLFVAGLAIDYGLKTLDHFDLIDSQALPKPVNLVQAKQVVGKLIAYMNENVWLKQMAGRKESDDVEATGEDAASPIKEKPRDDDEANLRIKRYVQDHPQATIRQVAEYVGYSVGKTQTLDAWRLTMARRKADKPLKKKTERPLTDKMLAVRGTDNDPAAKVMLDEVIWQWVVEKAKREERAELFLMSPAQKAKIIDLSREMYEKEHSDADD
jgi:hypothetical protein